MCNGQEGRAAMGRGKLDRHLQRPTREPKFMQSLIFRFCTLIWAEAVSNLFFEWKNCNMTQGKYNRAYPKGETVN